MSLAVDESARHILVAGVVQGVGFRANVYRLAHRHRVAGWVRNVPSGVEIHAEGDAVDLKSFIESIKRNPPPAARITDVTIAAAAREGLSSFSIEKSLHGRNPTVRISPDLPVCDDCLREMSAVSDRRYRYPYINCTNCGPRYSIIEELPYDRSGTTMREWSMCSECRSEYDNPLDRRFHAQPIACPVCGPRFRLLDADGTSLTDDDVIGETARRLTEGEIIAVKGLGGYHLACDARNEVAVRRLRERKFRKEKPFALMAADIGSARAFVDFDAETESLLQSEARPIVLAKRNSTGDAFAGVAPGNDELGVMLPYTPLHYLLFDSGAPHVLVMTSANRSNEPIAYLDDDAMQRLGGIADAFLIGQRPIARRVDDSVCRVMPAGPVILRRSRGYAPAAAATLPVATPILAVGADLKNTVTLAVNHEAFVSQHLGDLDQYPVRVSFESTIGDLLEMYRVDAVDLLVAHDAHPQYISTNVASQISEKRVAVQHHRAHVASVLAERSAWKTPVVAAIFDGTGYGDDGSIWGGEFFAGSLEEGFERVDHLKTAVLPGGDAAARHPVQAAAGFLHGMDLSIDFNAGPFSFTERFDRARKMIAGDVRLFATSSAGRLFDTVAALLGFTREMSFEGQAAIFVEQLGRASSSARDYSFDRLDYTPVLASIVTDRVNGEDVEIIARGFHLALASAIVDTATVLCRENHTDVLVISGGVFQNRLLVEMVGEQAAEAGLKLWMNHVVPPNDGGISLGQAAIAAVHG